MFMSFLPVFYSSLFWEVHTFFVVFNNPSRLSTNKISFVLKHYLLAADTDFLEPQLSLRQPVPQYLFRIMAFI